MPTLLAPVAIQQFKDNNGNSLVGGQLYTYQAGTSIPAPSYTDATGTSANTNPVILNSRGEAPIWLTPGQFYKLVLMDVASVLIWSADQVPGGFVDAALLPDTASSNKLRADLASAIDTTKGPNLIGFIAPGAGAVARTLQSKVIESVSVFNFMTPAQIADVQAGTLLVDVSTAFAAAVLATTNGKLRAPAGNYKLSPLSWIKSNFFLEGDGEGATTFTFSNATSDLIAIGDGTANPNNTGVRGISITSTVARTAGAAIRVKNGHNVRINNIRLDANMFEGFSFEAGAQQFLYYLQDYEINSGTFGIRVGAVGGLVQDLWLGKGIISACLGAGISLVNVSGVYASDIDIIASGNGIEMVPGAGQAVKNLFFTQVLADTCTNTGWLLSPSSTGYIGGSNFSNCWASTTQLATSSGLVVNNTGTIKGLAFSNFRAINNRGAGIYLAGGSDITFSNCHIGANSQASSTTYHGLNISSGVSNWSVMGGAYGDVDGIANQQGFGIFIGTGCTNYSVIGAAVSGNLVAPISDNSGAGVISGNPGFKTKTRGLATIATGTNSVTITHNLGYVPSAQDVVISSNTNMSIVGGVAWVSGITSTTLTISLSQNAAANGIFTWCIAGLGA